MYLTNPSLTDHVNGGYWGKTGLSRRLGLSAPTGTLLRFSDVMELYSPSFGKNFLFVNILENRD